MEEENKNVNEVEQPTPVVIPEPQSVSDTPPVEVTSPEMVSQQNAPVEAPAQPAVEPTPVAPVAEPKEKKKGPGAILGVVLVLLLLVGGGYFYLRSTHTGEKFLGSVVAKMQKEVKEAFDEFDMFDLDKDDYKVSGTAKVTTSGDMLSMLNNINLTYDVGLSLKSEYMYANLKLAQDDVVTDVKATVDDKHVYANLGDIFTKTVYTELEENIFASLKEQANEVAVAPEDLEDMEYVIDKVLEYMKEALLLSKIETKYEGLNVTYKYVIDESNKDKINEKFASLCKADAKVMKYMGEEALNLVDSNATLTITSQLISGELEALDLVADDSKAKVTKKSSNNYLVEVDDGEDKYNFDVTIKGKEYTIVIKDANNKELATIVVEEKSDNVHFVVKYKDEESKTDLVLSLDYKKASNSKYSMTVAVAATMDTEKVNLDASFDVEYKEGLLTKSVPEGATNINELSEEELNTLQSNLMTKVEGYKFYSLLESMMGSDDDYDYDYGY